MATNLCSESFDSWINKLSNICVIVKGFQLLFTGLPKACVKVDSFHEELISAEHDKIGPLALSAGELTLDLQEENEKQKTH